MGWATFLFDNTSLAGSSGTKVFGGDHYEIYSGTKTPDKDGWTYSKCTSCGYEWRSKTISEPAPLKETKNGEDL